MKRTRMIMEMPITIEVIDEKITDAEFAAIFDYFMYVDTLFNINKKESEISRLNSGKLLKKHISFDLRHILQLAEDTRKETKGYFNSTHNGIVDPSGIVKGWAIFNAANLLKSQGYKNFFIEAGGDIQLSGKNKKGEYWQVSICNPFDKNEIVAVLTVTNKGVSTSGKYNRGQNIYNPRDPGNRKNHIASLTMIGPSVYDADRFATAAFAMGDKGIQFIEQMEGFEGYSIDCKGKASYTSGFHQYIQ